MKKSEKIIQVVTEDKEIQKRINKLQFYNETDFISDAKCYIKALKEGRLRYSVIKVSASGMSRQIQIISCERAGSYKTKGQSFYYRQYYTFLKVIGYRWNKDRDAIIVSGCGMDMLFHTNYNIIHRLTRLGFINKKQCAKLSQMI